MNDNAQIVSSDLQGKNVLVRVDFNVPIYEGKVQDTTRISLILETINFLKKAQAKIILISHLGKTQNFCPEQSLKLVQKEASKIFNTNIIFGGDILASDSQKIIKDANNGDIILFENLRFHKEEEANDENFAKKIAILADFYINDAFSVSHRKHASIYLIPKFLPHAFGFAFKKEIETIDKFFSNTLRPKMCIIGGSKLSIKVKLLKNLVKKVDVLALGGGIAGAFLAFYGSSTLKIFDPKEYEKDVIEIIDNAKLYNCKLLMPVDFSALIGGEKAVEHAIISDKNSQASVFDIGPKSVQLFLEELRRCATILWNGPVGLFEKEPFDYGTSSIANEISKLTEEEKITSIVGGGDTVFAINKFVKSKHFSYISASGGAFLNYLEGSVLPGIEALYDSKILSY